VIGVLDIALKGKKYLVGDKCTIADLGFILWNCMVADICEEEKFMKTLQQDCPYWTRWRKRILACHGVQQALQKKADALAVADLE
jgi:Glutathione S-transferase, C-terminal domain.